LPEVGFAAQREDLAEKLAAPYEIRAQADPVTRIIIQHLLCPEIIPLFEEKLATSQ